MESVEVDLESTSGGIVKKPGEIAGFLLTGSAST